MAVRARSRVRFAEDANPLRNDETLRTKIVPMLDPKSFYALRGTHRGAGAVRPCRPPRPGLLPYVVPDASVPSAGRCARGYVFDRNCCHLVRGDAWEIALRAGDAAVVPILYESSGPPHPHDVVEHLRTDAMAAALADGGPAGLFGPDFFEIVLQGYHGDWRDDHPEGGVAGRRNVGVLTRLILLHVVARPDTVNSATRHMGGSFAHVLAREGSEAALNLDARDAAGRAPERVADDMLAVNPNGLWSGQLLRDLRA